MRVELEYALRSRYPGLYACRSGAERTPFDQWGFEHDDGWYPLLDALSVVLTQRNNSFRLKIHVRQVKQKLATLRFYAHGRDHFCDGAVEFACSISARLCERTGRPGLLSNSSGSLQTLAPGVDPAFQPKAATEATKRWIACCGPADAIVLARTAWPMTLIEVPAGLADVADALLGFLMEDVAAPHPQKCMVDKIHNVLDVSLNEAVAAVTDRQFGAIAVAQYLARIWIDPISGACRSADAGGHPTIGPPPTDSLQPALKTAHHRSFRNRELITAGGPCGCFYCLSRFDASEVGEWVDEGRTALCPSCHIDAVLSGLADPIDLGFLLAMNSEWFGRTTRVDLSAELAQLKRPGPETPSG
jgi:hypothetical protein